MNAYQQTITFLCIIAGMILFFVVLAISLHKDTTPQTTSSFNLGGTSPTPTKPTQPSQTEPDVAAWSPYENTSYNFSLSYPETWNKQEFNLTNGGILVAFSPDPLPCATCTYTHDGYFSVRVFSQKTNSELYAEYTTRMQNLGKSADYLTANINNQKGVAYDNVVDVPYHDWVYEISLDRNNGADKVLDSKVFQKVLNSFQFTGLIFNN